jgi:transcriptional regulator with XRE-family HTH domain
LCHCASWHMARIVAQFTTRNSAFTTSSKLYKLSTREDELIQMARRGGRVAELRQALGLTGDQFAARIVETAARFGAIIDFDKHKLSRIEGGTRTIYPEELVALLLLDPKKRPPQWLVFGELVGRAPAVATSAFRQTDKAKPTAKNANKRTGS